MKLDEGRKWVGRGGVFARVVRRFAIAWLDGARHMAIGVAIAFGCGWAASLLWMACRTGWRIGSQLGRWLP